MNTLSAAQGPRSYVGAALIFFALAIPFIAAALGKISASQAGDYTGRGVGSLLAMAFVSWVATRTRSARAKANGRIVVGVLLCAVVLNNVMAANREIDQAKGFVLKAMQFQEQQSAKFVALNERFAKLPLSSILTPENVATPTGRATGKATVAQMRALIAERNSMFQTYLVEMQRMVDDLPNETAKHAAMEPIQRNLEPTKKLYADLGRAQLATADAVDAVLAWCGAQGNRLQLQNGQLLFSTATQQSQMQDLLVKLNDVAHQEETVTAQVRAMEAQGVQNLEQSKVEAAAFLKQ